MSKYRCPTCGAMHKEFVPQCRLCGQSMSPNAIPINAPEAATVTSSKGGTKGVVLIGIGCVIAVVAVALVFGLVSGNKTLDNAKDKVIPGAATDGWSELNDPDGPMIVTLPGDRTKSSTAFPGTTDGKLTVWTSKISNDTIITVGYAKVTPPTATTTGSAPSTAALQNYLKDLSAQWVKLQNSDPLIGGTEQFVAGYPAYVVKGQARTFTVNGQPGYAQQALALKGDKLYAVTVLTVRKDADQFDRVLNSLQIG